jgi:hypothetical protein
MLSAALCTSSGSRGAVLMISDSNALSHSPSDPAHTRTQAVHLMMRALAPSFLLPVLLTVKPCTAIYSWLAWVAGGPPGRAA